MIRPPSIIAKRTFSLASQFLFAGLSGDRNPIHVDPVAARRTMAGQVIVYGVDSLLWALDALAHSMGVVAHRMTVRFLKPIYLDEEVECLWDAGGNRLTLMVEDVAAVQVTLKIGASILKHTPHVSFGTPRNTPASPSFVDCMQFQDQPFRIVGDFQAVQDQYPNAAANYGLLALNEIAAISNLVGMECPGLYSLDAAFDIQLTDAEDHPPTFSVVDGDSRFGYLTMDVHGNAIRAKVEAIYLPKPVSRPTLAEIALHVRPREFQGVNALIIGGSRGLGALTASVIGAGGGRIWVTYNVGENDAHALIQELRAIGAKADAVQLTVTAAPSPLLIPGSIDLEAINQVYYFATDRILGKRSKKFNDARFRRLSVIYVDGFRELCGHLQRMHRAFSVFYPSSQAVAEPPPELAEFAAAKLMGEQLCAEMGPESRLTILCPRLPQMQTDQTLSLIEEPDADSVEILLPLIRQMTAAGASKFPTSAIASCR